MKRKIVEQGGLTAMISLPRKWIKKYGLKKGDEIEMNEQGPNLLVSTEKQITKGKQQIKIKDSSEFFGRLIHSPYRFGVNELEIRYDNPDVLYKINEYLDQLMGFEIVEEKEGYLKIEMIAKDFEADFDKVLRRIMLMMVNSCKELSEAVKKNDKTKYNEIIQIEKTNNKLVHFCERLLNTKGYKDYKKTGLMYVFAWNMESVADAFRDLCKHLLDHKPRKEVIALFDRLQKYVKMFYDVYYTPSKELNAKFKKEFYSFKKQLNEFKTKNPEENNVLYYIRYIVDKLRDLNVTI